MRYRSLLALPLLGLAAACAPAANYWSGQPSQTQIAVSTNTREIALSPKGNALPTDQREKLAEALQSAEAKQTPEGGFRRTEVSVTLVPPAHGAASGTGVILQELYGFGLRPDQVRIGMPAANQAAFSVQLHEVALAVPTCVGITRDSILSDVPLERRTQSIGCASATYLAAMVADPRDLVQPRRTGPTEGAAEASAVMKLRGTLDATGGGESQPIQLQLPGVSTGGK